MNVFNSAAKTHTFNQMLNHCLPITCMQYHDGFLLLGEGPSIIIINTRSKVKPIRKQMFPSVLTIQGVEFMEAHCEQLSPEFGETVYSKVEARTKIVIWAGCYCLIVYLNRETGQLEDEIPENYQFDYLPITMRFLENGKYLVTLSALNYLFVYEFDTKLMRYEKKSAHHGTRANLYSGTISGGKLDELLIFSGTAYREINVWTISDDKSVPLQTLKGHNGVALSLQYYSTQQTLLSVSDDRSVVVWTKSLPLSEQPQLGNFLHIKTKYLCPEARIWKSILVAEKIISVGESSVIAIHDLNGVLLNTWKGHHGASIYQCTFNSEADILYTAAYDGSVCEWRNCFNRLETVRLPFDVNCNGVEAIKDKNKDFPRTIIQYDLINVIAAMDSGRIIVLNPHHDDTILFDSVDLIRYAVVSLSPCKEMLLVGSLNGDLYLLQLKYGEGYGIYRTLVAERDQYRPWSQQVKSKKKIVSIVWIHPRRALVAALDEVFVVEFQYQNKIHTVYEHMKLDNGEIVTKEFPRDIEVAKGNFIQTFNVKFSRPGVPAALEVDERFVVIGTETGSLELLKYGHERPISRQDKVHVNGVTCIVHWDDKIFTSGRNGLIRVHMLEKNTESENLMEVFNYTMNYEWVDGLYPIQQDLLICGFSGASFVISSWQERRILTEIENCGGGHRSWDIAYNNGTATFSYIRDKEVFYTKINLDQLMRTSIKTGLHSKTINCCIQIGFHNNKDDYCFASGSEDGTLRTFYWIKDSNEIVMDNVSNKHMSSIRALTCVKYLDEDTYYMFSGGGRSQLVAWRIRQWKQPEPLDKEFTDTLRLTDVHQKNKRLEMNLCGEHILCNLKNGKDILDTRIMDIAVTIGRTSDKQGLLCFCACSDGFVRALNYSPTNKKFRILALLSGNEHAITNVYADFENCLKYIYGSTSNGYLLIWEWRIETSVGGKHHNQTTLNPIFKEQIQNSAIMSLKVIKNESENFSLNLVIGTDDTAVAVFQLILPSDTAVFTLKQVWSRSFVVHRGAVVGVNYFSDVNTVIACSNDQAISFWDGCGQLRLKCEAGVTDCQGLVLTDDCILCYGNGISCINVPKFCSEK